MRPCPAALQTYLEAIGPPNTEVLMADLYTFTLMSGEVFRWSGWPTALTVPSASFPSDSINAGSPRTFTLGPRFDRSKISTKIGTEPTSLSLKILSSLDPVVGSFTFANAVLIGMLDEASVELDRLFAVPDVSGQIDTTLGCLTWFSGKVAETEVGRSVVTLTVKSLLNMLNVQQLPKRLFMSGCSHVFGDVGCGFNRNTGVNGAGVATGLGQITFTAVAGSTQGTINRSTAIPARFIQGTIIGNSGSNNGYKRTVRSLGSGSQAVLFKPFIYPVAIGDSFIIQPGCNHTISDGSNNCTTYSNLDRYGGIPYQPPPEAAA